MKVFEVGPASIARGARLAAARIAARLGGHRGFVVTGIPRSGTSLLCALLSSSPDTHCFNEIYYNVYGLPWFFRRMRKRIVRGEPVPIRLDSDGRRITSTSRDNYRRVQEIRLPERRDVVVGSKVTVPYLNCLGDLLQLGYPTVALVRDPVFTLASWRSEKMRDTPVDRVTEGDRHSHWSNVRFGHEEKLQRQAELWNHYAGVIWKHQERVHVLRYEDLVGRTDAALKAVTKHLGIAPIDVDKPLRTRNRPEHYAAIDPVRNLVKELCSRRASYGYA